MLDTVNSGLFAPLVGIHITVETAEGDLELEVYEIKESPQSAGPNAQRTPFTVLLRGAESPCLTGGAYNLRTENWRLDGLNINRILPPASSDGSGAFYQVAFN